MEADKISVIIPVYNNGHELEKAIQSVLNQDRAKLKDSFGFEIIVIDDASEPDAIKLAEEICRKYPKVKLLVNQKNAGPAATRNCGLKAATGNIIGFLDGDDEWPADKVENLLPLLRNNTTLEVAGGKIQYVAKDGAEVPAMLYEDTQQRLTHVHLGSLLIKREIFDRGFYFNESFRYSEDVDWWMQLREAGVNIAIIEATTLIYHVHGNNMSVNKSIKELDVLKVLHESIQRRKAMNENKSLPQVKDFRIENKDPLISIVLPLYNGKNLIKKALDSVFAQTYANIELCIIDDGSTDGGADWIESQYHDIKVFKQVNKGVAAARNKGIEISKGDIIAFLDQDDEWLPEKLQKQWELLRDNPYCAFVTCNQQFKCYEGTSLPDYFDERLKEIHRSFVPSAVLIRKHVLLSIKGFDETLEVSSDTDLIRRMRTAGFKEGNVDKLLLNKWFHDRNASFDKQVLKREMLQLLHRQMHGK